MNDDELVKEATRQQLAPLCVWYQSPSLTPGITKDNLDWHNLCHNICDAYNVDCNNYQPYGDAS